MLLVIDMQPRFPATKAIIANVIREVKKAKARGEWIFYLKVGPGRVAYRLTSLTRGYCKCVMVTKYADDGAVEVFATLTHRSRRRNGFRMGRVRKIRVCGVNTAACVYSTVKSLSYLDVEITVLGYATAQCRDGYSYDYNKRAFEQSLQAMKRLSNVRVIRKGKRS